MRNPINRMRSAWRRRRTITTTLLRTQLTFLALTVGFLNVHATGVKHKVIFSGNEVPRKSVFLFFAEQADFLCLYTANAPLSSKFIPVNADKVSFGRFLVRRQSSTYKIERKSKFISEEKMAGVYNALSNISEESTSMQDTLITLRGTVTSADGAPLAGVSVFVKGTDKGATTDSTGQFTLPAFDFRNSELVISSVGYQTKQVSVRKQTMISVMLEPDVSGLNDVVVVGYGTRQKASIVGSITTVQGSDLKDMPVNNVGQRLQGRVAGAQIYQTGGTPGGDMAIRIRGAASINAGNNPLIVVDGFPSQIKLSDISPSEIETISILKDASATSLYGARAANGVVLITTKTAKEGQKNISLTVSSALETVGDRGKPDVMSAREFAQFKKEWYEDAALYEGYTGGVPEPYQNPEQYTDGYGTDWYDVLLRRAHSQNYNLSIASGKKDLKSVLVFDYTKQEGVVLNSDFSRASARSNNIYTVSERLTVGLNVGISHINSHNLPKMEGQHQILQAAYLMDPTVRYQNPDGTYPISYAQPGMFANPNWYLVLKNRQSPSRITNVLATSFAEYEILAGLKFKISANSDIGNATSRYFEPSFVRGGLFSAPPQTPIGNYATSSEFSWLVENTLTYKKSIGKNHEIDALAGYSAQKFNLETSTINGTQYPDDEIAWINAANIRTGTGGITQNGIVSYIGRLNYGYKNRYILTAAFRRDGSSKFGSDAKWGNFPSIAVGWIVSEENFLKDIRQLSFLKIRTSYGLTGNNNIGDYTHYSTIGPANYVFNNQIASGRVQSNFGNSDLTWETTKQFDVGLDIGLFQNRVFLSYDYYRKITDGLLYGIDIPRQSGFATVTSNIGQFNFWGHEFELQTKNLNRSLIWNTALNVSINRNIVKKLGTNDAPIGAYGLSWDVNRTAVGRPMGQFFGFINDGIYMTQDEFDKQPKSATSMVGTVRYKDISGPDGVPDGVITPLDRTFIGDPNPDWIFGITNEFAYKNFDLTFVLAGSVGGDIADESLSATNDLAGIFNVTKNVARRWRSIDNPGDGIIPRTRTGTTKAFTDFATRQVFDGSYISAKNFTFGYSLPFKRYFKSIRLYASVQNLFILTNYPGMNPEVSGKGLSGLGAGWDYSAYPISRVYSLGLNVNFK